MVLAAHRSYAAAVRLVRGAGKLARTRRSQAVRAFGWSFVSGLGFLALVAIVSPASFGQPGAVTQRTGWPFFTLAALVAVTAALAGWRRAELAWLLARIAEPIRRPLDDEPGFDGAADALAGCPMWLRARFATAWVWLPAAAGVVGVTCALSSAYFVVDAVLAGGRVGWGQPLYALVFAIVSVAVFAAASARLASWRFATSVYREVTDGYAA